MGNVLIQMLLASITNWNLKPKLMPVQRPLQHDTDLLKENQQHSH